MYNLIFFVLGNLLHNQIDVIAIFGFLVNLLLGNK